MDANTRFEGRAGNRPGQYILSVKGPISRENVEPFGNAVRASVGNNLILDLTEMPRIDSMAIGALVQAFIACNKSGRRLALVGPSHYVKNVLKMTGIEPLFPSYEKLNEAEQSLG